MTAGEIWAQTVQPALVAIRETEIRRNAARFLAAMLTGVASAQVNPYQVRDYLDGFKEMPRVAVWLAEKLEEELEKKEAEHDAQGNESP